MLIYNGESGSERYCTNFIQRKYHYPGLQKQKTHAIFKHQIPYVHHKSSQSHTSLLNFPICQEHIPSLTKLTTLGRFLTSEVANISSIEKVINQSRDTWLIELVFNQPRTIISLNSYIEDKFAKFPKLKFSQKAMEDQDPTYQSYIPIMSL